MVDFSVFFGLDPTGGEAMALCAGAAAILAGSIAGGFVLLGRADHGLPRAGRVLRGPRDLGVLALWRLDRALRRERSQPVGTSLGARPRPAPTSVLGGRR